MECDTEVFRLLYGVIFQIISSFTFVIFYPYLTYRHESAEIHAWQSFQQRLSFSDLLELYYSVFRKLLSIFHSK